jgi:hypothetical protein
MGVLGALGDAGSLTGFLGIGLSFSRGHSRLWAQLVEYPAMPRFCTRRALNGCAEGHLVDTRGLLRGLLQWRGVLTLGSTHTRAHARERSKAELFGFSGFESDAVRPPLWCESL